MTSAKNYDLAVIGAGPGGYVAGLYASRRKLKVCVIEKDLVGGTCLNRGCIPTKSLINSASVISTIKNSSIHGVNVDSYKIDFGKMASRKDDVVLKLRAGIETLFKANKIDLVRGAATLLGPNMINVEAFGIVTAKYIIVASGSSVAGLPDMKLDEEKILSSDGILNIKELPASIAIIGGGVIGCEFASLFNVLGVKVTIVEFMDRLTPGLSREASKKLESIFRKRGMDLHLSSRAEGVSGGRPLKIDVTGGKAVEAEKILVSVGRRPNTDALGLGSVGIKTENGRIAVDEFLRTSVENIFAIGDCIGGPMFAHKASYDAMAACDNILGDNRSVDYSNIPNCVWTDPEIASVGMSEEDAKMKFPDAKVAKFPYLASGKANLEAKTEGYAKIIGNAEGEILGVEIFGKAACDLIGEAVLAKTAGIGIKEWAGVVHGHPTLSEILQEAAHVFCGTGIHSV